MAMHRVVRLIIRVILIAILVPVIGIVAMVGLLLLDHGRETSLPVPTGPFAVGRTTYVWGDPTHSDSMAPKPGTKRELAVWIWYPAVSSPSATQAEYMPAPWRAALERHSGVLKFLSRDLSRVRGHSAQDAAVSPVQPSYPVVLMRAGLAKLTTDYTSLAEDLASRGYVVVGFDAPYRTTVVVFPDGRVIERAAANNADLVGGDQQERLANRLVEAWSADTGFVLDQLAQLNSSDPQGRFRGRLDLQRVGVFGHSLGGATSLKFCHDDARCKVGIDVDGAPLGNVVADGVKQPFLFILSDHRGEPAAESSPIIANFHAIYDRLPDDRRLWVTIRGANHYRFSDDGAVLQIPLMLGALHKLGVVHLDGRRQIALTEHYIDTFFDVYLKGAPASELASRPEYPEVEYVR